MIERAADEILESLASEFSREIPSHVIGAKVMEKLHVLDQVAYVRFASVYRTFQDIDQFIDELQKLGQNFKRSELQPELFR
jgi:transcriptional repressor NrdR